MANSRKQRRLLEKMHRLKSLRRTYEDHCELALKKADAKAEAKIGEYSKTVRRKLAEENFGALSATEVIETVTAARIEAENKTFEKLLKDAAIVGRNLSESELEELNAVHEKRLAAIVGKTKEEFSSYSPSESDIEKAKKRSEEAQSSIYMKSAACHSDAERKKAAITGKYGKRISGLSGKLDAVERKLRELKPDAEGVSLEDGIALRVQGLKMYFGGVKAVDDLSFDVKEGEIFGLIGPNGAGKTTVFNCITQFYKPTAGTLLFKAEEGKTISLTAERVHDVIIHGIVRTFQNVEVVPEISVLENLLVAGHRQFASGLAASALHLPVMKMEEEVVRARAEKVLEFMGLSAYAELYAFGLPYGILKKIEIARTLMCSPRLIILDEPAAGLNDTETAELAQLIRRIRDEYNCTILLVEHDMGLVMDVCDNICAIAFGKLLAYGSPAVIQSDSDVQQAYLGVNEEEAENNGVT